MNRRLMALTLALGASLALSTSTLAAGGGQPPVDGASLARKVNEYEGQHRKVNEYEGQHRLVYEYEGQHR
jgi:hypothetical protein